MEAISKRESEREHTSTDMRDAILLERIPNKHPFYQLQIEERR